VAAADWRTHTERPELVIYWPGLSSHGSPLREYCGAVFHRADANGMPKENGLTFKSCESSTLFREFATECIELAQTTPSPEKRTMYLKMASVFHQMAQRWEKKSLVEAKRRWGLPQ